MKACPAREEALALLKKYNSEPFHIQHALTVEGIMRWYANELGYGEDADFWAMVGLLHDVDFEQFPQEHCKKAPELLAEINAEPELVRRTGDNASRTIVRSWEDCVDEVLRRYDDLLRSRGLPPLDRI